MEHFKCKTKKQTLKQIFIAATLGQAPRPFTARRQKLILNPSMVCRLIFIAANVQALVEGTEFSLFSRVKISLP